MKLNTSNSRVLIKILKKDKDTVIDFFIKNCIYFSYKRENMKYVYYVVNYSEYKYIKKKYKVKIIDYYGKKRLYRIVKNNYIVIIALFFSLILLIFLTNTCFGINIYVDDEGLKKEIYKILEENNVEKYKLKKKYEYLDNVKALIYKKYNDYVQWIEIKERGVLYDVFITKKIKNDVRKECMPQDIVASKDGLILSIVKEDGVVLKYNNDYVKKGEVLITGQVYNNSNLKALKCAKGKVYAEVWYTVSTIIPYKYTEYVSTGKKVNHYYLEFDNFDFTLLGYYKNDNVFSNKKVLIEKFYLPFKLIKEEKEIFTYKKKTLTKEEAYKEAIKRSDKAVANTLKTDEYIIDKKVLKNSEFSSKISIEVFYKVYEDITEVKLLGEESKDDTISN